MIMALLVVIVMSCHASQKSAVPVVNEIGLSDNDYSPTTLIISCDSTVGKQPLREAVQRLGATVVYDYKIVCGMAIRKPDNMTLDEAIEYFSKINGVIAVTRDRIIRLTDPVRPPQVSF